MVSPRPVRLTLGVTDLAISAAFYADLLGLDAAATASGAELRFGAFVVALESTPPTERAKVTLTFAVDDAALDGVAERARTRAEGIVAGPFADGGRRALRVIDPDHYTLEFVAG